MTKTIQEVLAEIRLYRPLSEIQLRRYLKNFGIAAVGVRQKPQRYPADTAQRILSQLGLAQPAAKPVSMAQLKAERAKAQRREA